MLLDLEAGLPLDYDHATEWDAFAPAAGWLKQFEVRDGAIWAHIEWTDKGRRAVASKEYRYISPVFRWNERTGEVMQLLRAALTNNPNLQSTAICGKEEKLVISVAIPIVSQKERGMLSETEKVIIGRFAHVSETAFAAMVRGSEPFGRRRNERARLRASPGFPAHL
jgi:phage I-like protein